MENIYTIPDSDVDLIVLVNFCTDIHIFANVECALLKDVIIISPL